METDQNHSLPTPLKDETPTSPPSFALPDSALTEALAIVTTWTPGTELSSTMTISRTQTALVAARSRVSADPMTRAAIGAATLRIRDFAATFAIQINAGALAAEYQEHLAELPSDVIPVAVHRCLGNWKWRNWAPMPADLIAAVAPEMIARRDAVIALQRAELYRRRNPLPDEPRSDGEVRRLAALTQATADRLTRGLDKRSEDLSKRAPTPPEVLAAELDGVRQRMAARRAEREATQED